MRDGNGGPERSVLQVVMASPLSPHLPTNSADRADQDIGRVGKLPITCIECFEYEKSSAAKAVSPETIHQELGGTDVR